MARGEPTTSKAAHDAPLSLVPGVNLRALSSEPAETFVLACIDGVSSELDIASTTGLGVEAVGRIVESLVARGAVVFAQPSAPEQLPRAPQAKQSGAYPVQDAPRESLDLSDVQRARLFDLDRRLGSLDHYELLGIEPAADPKSIRAAYYELVRAFHPDRFFGKRLGSLGNKLLRVFARITEAYEVLHQSESRAEYDRYLAARRRTVDFEARFHDPEQKARELESALQRIERVAAADSVAPTSGTVRRPSGSFASDPDARRRALARKLGHSTLPPPRSPSSSPSPSPSSSSSRSPSSSIPASSPPSTPASRAADDLKQRYQERLARARVEQRNHYLTLASEAAERNDLIAASNALRVACSLAPGDLELAGDLAEMERRAAAGMWESYLERGKYAAIEGHAAEAAEAYERAALGHPSASLFERAAFHLLDAGGDLKHAAQLAKQAVSLAPNSARCRLTLGQIYASAKLRESALAELERARSLEPDQPLIKEWIARVKRGDI